MRQGSRLRSQVYGAANDAVMVFALEGNHGSLVLRAFLAGFQQPKVAVDQFWVLQAQGDDILVERVPPKSVAAVAGEEVPFKLDAGFFADFGVGQDATALVADSEPGMNGRAIHGAEFLSGKQKRDGAPQEEEQLGHGKDAPVAEPVDTAPFVVVVGIARQARTLLAFWQCLFVGAQDVFHRPGETPIRVGQVGGRKIPVGHGFGRLKQAGLSRRVYSVIILHDLVEVVVIRSVKAPFKQGEIVVAAVAFGHEQDFALGMASLQLGQGLVPESLIVNEVRHVDAEAVHPLNYLVVILAFELQPEIVGFDHGLAQAGVGVVEFGGVAPIEIEGRRALLVVDVVLGMFLDPNVIAAGVIGDHAKDDA